MCVVPQESVCKKVLKSLTKRYRPLPEFCPAGARAHCPRGAQEHTDFIFQYFADLHASVTTQHEPRSVESRNKSFEIKGKADAPSKRNKTENTTPFPHHRHILCPPLERRFCRARFFVGTICSTKRRGTRSRGNDLVASTHTITE